MRKTDIQDLDDLRMAAEDAAEKVIFKHAHLISEEVQRQIWARGLPVCVLQGNEIVHIYPDGSCEVLAISTTSGRVKVPRKHMTLKKPA